MKCSTVPIESTPGVEFVVTVPRDQILLLPRDSTKLWRPALVGQFGYFNVHVYRDCQIEEYPAEVSTRVAVCPLIGPGPGPASAASDYIGDLTSGEVTVVLYD